METSRCKQGSSRYPCSECFSNASRFRYEPFARFDRPLFETHFAVQMRRNITKVRGAGFEGCVFLVRYLCA